MIYQLIRDEHSSYQAEKYKLIPLDPNDPEAKQISDQIIKEARGNRNKAREIAIKKGYKL